MDNEWEKHKRTLAELHFAQRKSLDDILKHMADNYNFHAKPCEYKQQFRLWDLPKNLKGEHWKAIDLKVKERKREGKQSDIYVHGIKLPRRKISKQISQQGIFSAAEMYRRAQNLDVPSWLLIRTPSPSPPGSPFLGQSEKSGAGNRELIHQIVATHISVPYYTLRTECISALLMTCPKTFFRYLPASIESPGAAISFDRIRELLRTGLNGTRPGTEAVPVWNSLIVPPAESSGGARNPLQQLNTSWLKLSKIPTASSLGFRHRKYILPFAIRFIRSKGLLLSETLCSLTLLGEDMCFQSFLFEFHLVQLISILSELVYYRRGFTVQDTFHSPTIQAAYDNDVPKLQQLFLAGKVTACDMYERNMSSLIFVSAWAGAYDAMLLIIRQSLSMFDAHWRKYSILWWLWIGFFDRLESGNYYPRTTVLDFESCVSMCQLVLEKNENEADIEECTDVTENLGNLLHVPCQYDLSDLDLDVLEKIARYMLQIGTEIEYRSKEGLTPLLYAASSSTDSSAYIRILIKYGANVFTTDNEGRGPLHIAIMIFSNERMYHAYSDDPRHILVANLRHKLDVLIDAGCDPHASDNWGMTPSQYIQQGDIWECWSLVLLNCGNDICHEMPPFTYLPIIQFEEVANIIPAKGDLHIHFIRDDEGDDNSGEIRQLNEESIHMDETSIQCLENEMALDLETPSKDNSGAVTNIDEDIEMFSYIGWSLTDSVGDMAVHL